MLLPMCVRSISLYLKGAEWKKKVVFLTVLKIGGVSIGSFLSKKMLARASIRVSDGKFFFRPTVKVTNPWPVVPLFGGRKPIRGSSGGSPARKREKNAEPRKTPPRTSVRSSLTLNRAKYKDTGANKSWQANIFNFWTHVCLIIDTRVSCYGDMQCSTYLSSLYSIHQPTLLFSTAREHNGPLAFLAFLHIILKQCFKSVPAVLMDFHSRFILFGWKNSTLLRNYKKEFCSCCLIASSPGLSDQQDRVLALFWWDAVELQPMSFPKTKTTGCCVDAQPRPNLSWMTVKDSNVTLKELTCLWVQTLKLPTRFTSDNVYPSKHSDVNLFFRHKINYFLSNETANMTWGFHKAITRLILDYLKIRTHHLLFCNFTKK